MIDSINLIYTKQVENSRHKKLVEKTAKKAKKVESTVLKEKHILYWFGDNFDNATNCEFFNTKTILLGPLYCNSSLFGR